MYTFDIKLDLFKKIQAMKATYMSNAKTGDVISTLMSDTGECVHFIVRNVIHLSNGIIRGLFYVVYIYKISVEAGLVVSLFLPIAVWCTFKFSKRIRQQTDSQRQLYGNYCAWLFEILSGLTDIRLLCAQKTIRRDFTKHLKSLFNINIKTSVVNKAADKIMEFVNLLLQLCIYGVCAYLAINEKISIGSVMVLISFVFTLKDEIILGTARSLMDAQNRLTRIARIKKFLSQPDENSWLGTRKLIMQTGQIKFNCVKFSYEQNSILEDFNLEIKPGSHIGLVGKSGAGKTTIASLLIGLYEPQLGTITVDGQDLTQCTLKSIRQNIGIIQQETLIFDGSIKDNLLLGNPKASDYELWQAAKKAGVAQFFDSLPEKLDTLIGKNGLGLSGGQRQRLSIARIYLKNPSIIVFDEATSALDSETEELIHQSWADLLNNRTAIIIAHRLSSVLLCDSVALIEEGKVKVIGKPNELLEKDGDFRALFAIH
jgi:ABC-type multidrug transport system fused ATPase/permease subunit